MKELDDRTAELLKALNEKEKSWRTNNPRVVVWAFWLDGDVETAKAWALLHGLDRIIFAVAPADGWAKWKIHSMASNVFVLSCRRKTAMATYTDLKVEDIGKLESKLLELVGRRKRD